MVRGPVRDRDPDEDDPDEPPLPRLDLHGLHPEQALRRLRQEIHACRYRRLAELLVITGAGYGNALGKPILRGIVVRWLDGPEGRSAGVLGHEVRHKGGALLVRLRA